MAHYRLPELDLSTRIALAIEMLQPIPERDWGRATELARTHSISRQLLYQIRDRASESLIASLMPRQPGPQPLEEQLVIDKNFIKRTITVLPLLKGSIRDIQQGLCLLLGVRRSVGYISETLTSIGEPAEASISG